ncbi:MAG: hypothetical protein KA314_15580 [Chloroflexi bacterium]|nr:hypothetical protein [Chloroflexota bacterium]MBP8057255.1 hypothetical protein [Chloroflexota bacterium]
MGDDFPYKEIIDDLQLVARLGSNHLAHMFKTQLDALNKQCLHDLADARNEKNQFQAQLQNAQEDANKHRELLVQERARHTQLEQRQRQYQGGILFFALLWPLVIGLSLVLLRPQQDDLSTVKTIQQRLFPVMCPDQAIEALALLENTRLIAIVISGEHVTTHTTDFALVPIVDQAFSRSHCEFAWTIFYGTTVLVWQGRQFIPDQTIIIADGPVNPMAQSTCQLLLSVAPFDKHGRTVNNTSFSLHIEECPYS